MVGFRLVMHYVKRYPGFLFLFVLLTGITSASMKPEFYFVGWDNYSSYFELPTNMFRTIFATWRDYRGFGVPSDGESTDIFRQLFYWMIHFFVPERMLDQVFYQVALWLGILGMYFLSREVFSQFYFSRKQIVTARGKDLFASIAAFFYLFNLNTLSVFYSPMIPFTMRFFALPITLYVFIRYVKSGHSFRYFLLLAGIIITTSGSYITPTIFITTSLSLFIFALVQYPWRKVALYTISFLFLNAFWLLPFANYTIQKSAIVPLARTFVEINESMLNTAPSEFALQKQVILTPSFFGITFKTLSTSTPFPIHPNLKDFTIGWIQSVLYLFPMLYFIGCLLIVYYWKRSFRLFWIPLWIALYLFLSTKEFGPLGFVYTFLKTYIPFFGVIFRIADTKFHLYISLAGSLAAAYAIVVIWSTMHRKILRGATLLIVIVCFVLYAVPFRGYFSGELTGFFAYTDIPDVYKKIAQKINASPGYGRVLHLPMDSWHSYWRSYSWGYVGSSFLNFMINKPYIDKTFEPASMENVYFHARITQLLDSFYRTTLPDQKKRIADSFLLLLRETGVEFVLADGSVSSIVTAKNMQFGARQYYIQVREMVEFLFNEGALEHVDSYAIPIQPLIDSYRSLYPAWESTQVQTSPLVSPLALYRVLHTDPYVRFADTVTNVDPGIGNVLETDIRLKDQTVIQDTQKSATLFPFFQQNHSVKQNDQSLTLSYTNPNKDDTMYSVTTPISTQDSFLVDVYAEVVKNTLAISFRHRYLPDINGKKFERPIGSLSFPVNKKQESDGWDLYRLQLGDVVLPIPSVQSGESTYIGSYMLHEKTIRARVLTKEYVLPQATATFTPLPKESCLGFLPSLYEGTAEISNTSIEFTASSGSSCVQSEFTVSKVPVSDPVYVEFAFLTGTVSPRRLNSSSSIIAEQALDDIGERLKVAYFCLQEEHITDCMNGNRLIRLSEQPAAYQMPVGMTLSPKGNYFLTIGTVGYDQIKASISIADIQAHVFTKGIEQTLEFLPVQEQETVSFSGPLVLSFPKALSSYSTWYDLRREMYLMSFDSCRDKQNAVWTTRFIKDSLFSVISQCSAHHTISFSYAPDRPYLFLYDYWIGNGQHPTYMLDKNGDRLFMERASLYQGYPDMPYMGELKDPSVLKSVEKTKAVLSNVQIQTGSRLIDPIYFSDSAPSKTTMDVFQDTQNIGVAAVGSLAMVEYPSAWQQMQLSPKESGVAYVFPPENTYSYTQLLPSLWKVEGSISDSMMVFNSGFDAQWQLYDGLFNLFRGKSIGSSVRCNGYANCFAIPKTGANIKTHYIFYTPEKLNFFGWGVTLGVLAFGVILARRQRN